ncbi:hypothetical protein L7F22_015180 [Adiantum nelumboides]|nr:hypothetical protein [Adiantum nelumboides]
MSKASVKRSPAKRASNNAVAEEPLLLEATLQKSSPLQREKKRASADFEVSASNSKAPMKVAKAAYQYPRLYKFCYSADDLHSEYGLSLEGKLPRDIVDDEISDKDWLTVFNCLHQKNTKLYISSVREEFVDECRLLYQKVYQAAPSNGELLAKFARGFVYERSRASSDPDSRRIAWARFGGAVLDNCKLQKGGLERKINKFRADYGIVKLEASNCDVVVSSIPTISASKLEGRQVVEQPMYMQQVLSIAEGIKLEELKKELEHLKNSPNATPRDIDCKELKVQAITKVLAKVGASSESLNMKQDLDALQMGEKPVFFKSLETFSKRMQGLGKYSTLVLDDSYYKNHLNEKGTYVVLPGIEQQSEEQWDGFLRNDVLQFLYTWVDAKEEDRFKIVKECNFDVSESAEQRLDTLFIKKNLEGGGTIYPPRNLGLHENPEPKNPGFAAGDPGSAFGSPRKRGHPRPQYKRPGTQWHK